MKISELLKTDLWCYLQSAGGAWAKLRCLGVCRTPEQQARGLQGRKGLLASECLLFAWPQENEQTFHMRGVTFPLDMIAIGSNQQVTRVVAEVPPETPAVPLGLCQWVIECPAGWSQAHGVGVGDLVAFKKQNRSITS